MAFSAPVTLLGARRQVRQVPREIEWEIVAAQPYRAELSRSSDALRALVFTDD